MAMPSLKATVVGPSKASVAFQRLSDPLSLSSFTEHSSTSESPVMSCTCGAGRIDAPRICDAPGSMRM